MIACEPLPPTFECLAANVAAHRRWWGQRQQQQHTSAVVAAAGPGGDDRTGSGPAPVLALNLGVGDGSAAEAEFTLYPRAAGWSSMQPAGEEVQAAMAAFLRNAFASRQAAEAAGIDPATAAVGAWLHRVAPGWLNAAAWRAGVAVLLGGAARHRCRLASVSQLIREQGLQRVDFLKVDVERAELEVLRGVEGGQARIGAALHAVPYAQLLPLLC